MKKIISVLILSIVSISAFGRQPERGYRGFAEVEYDAGKAYYFSNGEGRDVYDGFAMFGIATTHGYQFNNHIFVGGGAAIILNGGTGMIPLYADIRYDNQWGKFTPFADLKTGYDLPNESLYFSPTVGYRFNWGRKVNLNLGLGMTLKGYKTTEYHGGVISVNDARKYNALFTLRFGLDF